MDQEKDFQCDVLVAGSGVAGMAAAITAAHKGLDVMLIEKSTHVGGSTARSGGWLWIPGTSLARANGVVDSDDDVETYVRGEAGEFYDAARFRSFLRDGPEALDFFLQNTALKVDLSLVYPDYHPEAAGASKGGRSMSTTPLDGRELGKDLDLVARPLPELMVFGMMLGSGKEIWHFLRVFNSFESFLFVARLVSKNALETLRYGRSMRLTNGNALVGRLLKSARDKQVRLKTSTSLRDLYVEQGAVAGAWIEHEGRKRLVRARHGVVLACGGFSHDTARRKALFKHSSSGTEHYSPAAETNTGDGQRAAERVGGKFSTAVLQPAAWFPVSVTTRPDRSKGVMPHFIDRAKPGVIAVCLNGTRFANEASSYHDFVQRMIAASKGQPEAFAWLICDHTALRTYGLGRAAAFPMPLRPHLRSGYLKRGANAEELALAIGVNPQSLRTTIEEFNRHAAAGEDPVQGKGSSHYNRFMGDPRNLPNPCVRPLASGPLYAIRLVVGDAGTYAGLATDVCNRVLDGDGHFIPGLYAVGCDAVHMMGGSYPGAGICLGPGLVAGYAAAKHIESLRQGTGPDNSSAELALDSQI